MNYSRREILALSGLIFGAAVLDGCATGRQPTAANSPSADHSGPPSPSVQPPPTSMETPTPTPLPDRGAIANKYAARQPQEWGLDVTGVVTRTELPTVALTFDGCGGPSGSAVDQDLLNHLIETGTKATLFLNYRWIQANRKLTESLAANPLFQIGNHGWQHLPLSVTGRSAYRIPGTKDVPQVIDEIWRNHEFLTQIIGRSPRFFRSGTAHYDEVAVEIVRELGEIPVNFSINGDAGATASKATIINTVSKARSGDIVIAHLNRPTGQTAEGFAVAINRLRDSGVTFGHLVAS